MLKRQRTKKETSSAYYNNIPILTFLFSLKPFDEITLKYDKDGKLCKSSTTNLSDIPCTEEDVEYTVDQQVFVDHCIMNTQDAALTTKLDLEEELDIYVNKGSNSEVRSWYYQCFIAVVDFMLLVKRNLHCTEGNAM